MPEDAAKNPLHSLRTYPLALEDQCGRVIAAPTRQIRKMSLVQVAGNTYTTAAETCSRISGFGGD